jgi:hypothetical protein
MRLLILAFLICCLAPLRLAAQQTAPNLPKVTKFDCPKYPDKARSAHISGTVRLEVTTDGHEVSNVKIVSGPPILAAPAEANVRTWKFANHEPTTFTVTYVDAVGSSYKKDAVTKCDADLNLPTEVTVGTTIPFPN